MLRLKPGLSREEKHSDTLLLKLVLIAVERLSLTLWVAD